MKLHTDEVGRIVTRLLFEWHQSGLVTFKAPEDKIRHRLIEIFTKDLKVEDDLNQEVEKMLSKYEREFQSGALDRRKMFTMIKNQLIKDRRLVI